jgi:hypothetical protein
MEPPRQLPTESASIEIARRLMILDRQIRSGLGWFYWIAGLSLINSITYLFNLESSFVVGLGVTQLIDALALAIAQESTAEVGLFLRMIGYAFDLALIVAFILFGIFGRKRVRWVIITGMVLYALDTILVLVFRDWFSALFHVLALWGIWTGFRAIKHLTALETTLPASFPVTAHSAYSSQTAIAPEKPGMNRVILGILLAAMLILVAVTLVRTLAP